MSLCPRGYYSPRTHSMDNMRISGGLTLGKSKKRKYRNEDERICEKTA